MKSTRLEKLPQYASDEDAERFVAQSDLSEYDLSGFRPLSVVAAAKEPAATATAAAKKSPTTKAQKRSPGRSIGSRTASGKK